MVQGGSGCALRKEWGGDGDDVGSLVSSGSDNGCGWRWSVGEAAGMRRLSFLQSTAEDKARILLRIDGGRVMILLGQRRGGDSGGARRRDSGTRFCSVFASVWMWV